MDQPVYSFPGAPVPQMAWLGLDQLNCILAFVRPEFAIGAASGPAQAPTKVSREDSSLPLTVSGDPDILGLG